jgi:hypothetical protein
MSVCCSVNKPVLKQGLNQGTRQNDQPDHGRDHQIKRHAKEKLRFSLNAPHSSRAALMDRCGKVAVEMDTPKSAKANCMSRLEL